MSVYLFVRNTELGLVRTAIFKLCRYLGKSMVGSGRYGIQSGVVQMSVRL